MRTTILSFVMSSENRKEITKTLFEYPKRQWSCSALEEISKLPHTTVFRALKGLVHHGIIKQSKINKKDLMYELVDSQISAELKRALNLEKITAKSIAMDFVNKIKFKKIKAVVFYGSSFKGTLKAESDIDILVVANKKDNKLNKEILEIAANISSKANKSISAVIMSAKQINREKNSQFLNSVKENMEVLYGKSPF